LIDGQEESVGPVTRPYVRSPIPNLPMASLLSGSGPDSSERDGPEPEPAPEPVLPRHRRPGPTLTGPGLPIPTGGPARAARPGHKAARRLPR
jgi:hypothetical protein